MVFVVKLNSSHARPEDLQHLLDFVHTFGDNVVVIDRVMSDAEVKALHVCCDAFVSLHRCEGYGVRAGGSHVLWAAGDRNRI